VTDIVQPYNTARQYNRSTYMYTALCCEHWTEERQDQITDTSRLKTAAELTVCSGWSLTSCNLCHVTTVILQEILCLIFLFFSWHHFTVSAN